MSTRIAILGAGSQSFGPTMIRDILLSEDLCLFGVDLRLMDIRAAHLKDTVQYAGSVMDRLDRKIKISATTDLESAVKDADYVITAFEVDRYFYWAQDFSIPRKYGFKQIYGENGGPGGLFHALRNMGPLLKVAHTMEKLCPKALLINFSNPEQKLVEAVAKLTNIHVVGLCHGYFDGRRQLSRMLNIPTAEIDGRACGMNHFTFFQTIKHRPSGADLYPKLKEVDQDSTLRSEWHEVALGRALFRTFGLWPSPGTNHYGEYIRWAPEFMASEMHFYFDPLKGEPWKSGKTPDFIYTIDKGGTHPAWSTGEIQDFTNKEPQELYKSDELAVPIMEGLTLGKSRELESINVMNREAIPGLPSDFVVEVPALVDLKGIHPIRMEALPEAITAMIRTQASISKLLVEAYAQKSKEKLLHALLLDPTVDSYRNAVLMMDEMLELQRDLLPEL
jgi:alpha-galactosidase